MHTFPYLYYIKHNGNDSPKDGDSPFH